MKARLRLLSWVYSAMITIALLVSACSGISPNRSEQATEIAANIFATQTESVRREPISPLTTSTPSPVVEFTSTPIQIAHEEQSQETATPTPLPTSPPGKPATLILVLNPNFPPFVSTTTRQALSMLIDREAIASIFETKNLQPATSILPPSLWPDRETRYRKIGLPFNPLIAREFLDPALELGNLEFWMPSSDFAEVIPMIPEMWQEAIDFEPEFVFLERDAYFSGLMSAPPPVFFISIMSDDGTAIGFLEPNIQAVYDILKWENPTIEQMVLDARTVPDDVRRFEFISNIEQSLTEDEAIFVPIYHFYIEE